MEVGMTPREVAIEQIRKFWGQSGKEIPVFRRGLPDCRISEYAFILMNLRRVPMRILDAGTGASLLPAFLSSLGHSVVALDSWDSENKSKEGSREYAEKIREEWGGNYEICPAVLDGIPFGDQVFNAVICNSTIEHVSEENDADIKVVKELLRVAREMAIFTFPVEVNPKHDLAPRNATEHPCERKYSFNTAIQRLVVPAIESGFTILKAEGMEDDGKLLLTRLIDKEEEDGE
jgi:ubiquinone/menaquinone biosynthesis C-methylase UbiE